MNLPGNLAGVFCSILGCQLCMGHAVDQHVFSLLQQDVRELIGMLKKSETELSPSQGSQVQQEISETGVKEPMDALQIRVEGSVDGVLQRQEMQEKEIRVATANLAEENKNILGKLVSIETLLSGKLQENGEGSCGNQ